MSNGGEEAWEMLTELNMCCADIIPIEDNKNPDCGKPSIFMGERQSSVLVLLKKSLITGVIKESLCKLR
jgi:hypothetical protein